MYSSGRGFPLADGVRDGSLWRMAFAEGSLYLLPGLPAPLM